MTSFHANFDESMPNESILLKKDDLMIKLEDWFDPCNHEHMKAYEKLCESGCWPKSFVPLHVCSNHLSVLNVNFKIAQAWLHAMKHGQIIGAAPF